MSGVAFDLLLQALPVAFIMFVVLNFGGLLTWVERKQSAIMQDRLGANRASIFGIRVLGLLHPLADAIKMLTKEDFMPARADRLLFKLAPFISVFFALGAFASIPFGDTLKIAGREIQLQAVTLNVGILYVLAMLSLGVYGLMMTGWASANNYALLGGWQVPYLASSGFSFPWGLEVPLPHLAVTALQVIAFLTKVVVLIWFLMLIRWTLPRFRYDQAMRLGWLGLFPLSILNIVITGFVLLMLGKASP